MNTIKELTAPGGPGGPPVVGPTGPMNPIRPGGPGGPGGPTSVIQRLPGRKGISIIIKGIVLAPGGPSFEPRSSVKDADGNGSCISCRTS